MKVHFSEFETEDGWDYVYIYDKSDNEIASYTGSLGAFWSAEVNFKTIKIRLVTNNTITDYGFDIDEYAYEHIPAPSTIEGGDVIMFGDESDNFEHAVIVVGGSGDNAYCNAHSADHYHTSWTDWVDGTLPNPFTITNFYEIPSYAGGQANLTSYTPEGWDDPLIISSVTGTHTDGPHFIVNEPSYIDWTILNDGYADIPDTVYYVLLDDGDEVQTWFTKGLWYNHYTSVVDYEYTVTSEGWHTISISADPDDYWDESDEYDNSYSEYWNWIEHGVEEPSDINQAIIYSLQIFPNPFFKRTKINYSIASKGDVILRIYDASGRLVKEFMAKNQNPGHYKVMWGCKNKAGLEVSAGIYYVKLFSRNYSLTQKMVLIQ